MSPQCCLEAGFQEESYFHWISTDLVGVAAFDRNAKKLVKTFNIVSPVISFCFLSGRDELIDYTVSSKGLDCFGDMSER